MNGRRRSLLALENVNKVYGRVKAIQNVSFDIYQGDFFVIIGPSGCGKTTLLKAMAGIEVPTNGVISFDSRNVLASKSKFGDIVMVWQSLALFPHMDVEGNVGFGLRVRRIDRNERRRRVADALSMVDLAGYERRRIDELSGGEQQRVALARALIISPRLLLLDEPFGSLDPHLRSDLQVALTQLHRNTQITFVMVTHDQSEAVTLATRLAVMHRGQIEQIGTPQEILNRPATSFVAEFVGNKNVFPGKVESIRENIYSVRTSLGVLNASVLSNSKAVGIGSTVVYVVHANEIVEGDVFANRVRGSIVSRSILGSSEVSRVMVDNGCVVNYERCRQSGEDVPKRSLSAEVVLSWPETAAYLLPNRDCF